MLSSENQPRFEISPSERLHRTLPTVPFVPMALSRLPNFMPLCLVSSSVFSCSVRDPANFLSCKHNSFFFFNVCIGKYLQNRLWWLAYVCADPLGTVPSLRVPPSSPAVGRDPSRAPSWTGYVGTQSESAWRFSAQRVPRGGVYRQARGG